MHKEFFKEFAGAVPWYFKVAWAIGVILSLSAILGVFALIAVLIRHFW